MSRVPTSPPQSRARMTRAARRDQLLDIAIDLFAERGYDAASMDELARRAGISKPIVYDHFGSKDGVFNACIERNTRALTKRIAEATVQASGPEERLRAGSLAFFEFIAEHARPTPVRPRPSSDPLFEDHVVQVRRSQSNFTAAMIMASARELGVGADPVRVDAVANAMIGAYEALAVWWGDHPNHTAAEITDWFVEFVGPGLGLLLARPTD